MGPGLPVSGRSPRVFVRNPGMGPGDEREEERIRRVLEARKLEGRGGLTIPTESSGGDLSLQHRTASEGALSEGGRHSEAAPDASE